MEGYLITSYLNDHIQNLYTFNKSKYLLLISNKYNKMIGIFAAIFYYIYFTNSWTCLLIGLGWLSHLSYSLITVLEEKKLNTLLMYTIIYSNFELITQLLVKLGVSEYNHFKCLILFALIYTSEYKYNTLKSIYDKTIEFDIFLKNIFLSAINLVNIEIKKMQDKNS